MPMKTGKGLQICFLHNYFIVLYSLQKFFLHGPVQKAKILFVRVCTNNHGQYKNATMHGL